MFPFIRSSSSQGSGTVSASIEAVAGTGERGDGGLIEKVDVLAEIPYVSVAIHFFPFNLRSSFLVPLSLTSPTSYPSPPPCFSSPSCLRSLKKVVAVATGTKPYIFQHFREGELHLTLPGAEEKVIQGKVFDELTFISE